MDFVALERMKFEETYRGIANYRKFARDEKGFYYDGGTEEAWKLWQAARISPEYINRPTVELVQDLYNYVNRSVTNVDSELKERVRTFLKENASKVTLQVVGPWTDK